MWSVMAARIAGQKPRHEVAICATGDSPQEMETANAAFIVKCVNAHDELIASLKIVANWPVSQPFDNQDAMNMAKIAIDALSKLGD